MNDLFNYELCANDNSPSFEQLPHQVTSLLHHQTFVLMLNIIFYHFFNSLIYPALHVKALY